MKRLKTAQIPAVTAALLKRQGGKCPLCNGPIGPRTLKKPALDHDHKTGYIRDVLCFNCNGIEGKVHNLIRRIGAQHDKLDTIQRIADYWKKHSTPQHGGYFHPKHKTEDEKRIERNRKAVLRRKKAKDNS